MKRNGFQFALRERESKIGRLSTRFDFQGGSVTSVNSLYFIFIVVLCVKYYGFFFEPKKDMSGYTADWQQPFFTHICPVRLFKHEGNMPVFDLCFGKF